MTSEQFHDALTLLPEDLVARADSLRHRPSKVIRWKRYAALAACFAVLLLSFALLPNPRHQETTVKMTAAPAPAMEAETPEAAVGAAPEAASGTLADRGIAFSCVETPYNPHTTACFASGPSPALIPSREELDAYFAKWDRLYLLDPLRDACEIYDTDWFASHDLLLIPVDCVTGPCTVTAMSVADGACEITVVLSGENAAESTNYHIALPVEKGSVTDAQNIIVIYNSDTNG